MDEEGACVPESAASEGARLLDLFLKDMDELDASQFIEAAKANETLNNTHTRPFERFVTCERAENVRPNVAAPLTTRKKKQSWQRRKEELHKLRQETQAMETHVVFLRLQRQNRQARGGSSQKAKGPSTTEQQRLEKAQQENSELKDKVRAYQQLLDALQAAVTNSSLQELTRPANSIQAAIEEPQALQIDSESADIFTTLETVVDNRFQDLQSILDKLQLKSTAVDAVEVQICNGDDGAKATMEYKCVQVLPFDDVAASKAFWSLVEVCNSPQRLSQVVRRSENTYSTRSRITLRLDQDTMLFAHVCTVLKRHAVLEGSVMLGESTTNWSAFRGASELWSHESRESGLFAVHRFPLDKGVSTDIKTCQSWGCQVNAQICSKATGQGKSGLPSTHAIVLPFYRELLDAQRQFLENRLWDSVRAATN